MVFKGFIKKDFRTFTINGLDNRMEAIRERIQPKFQQIGEKLQDDLSTMTGNDMHIHIAQHARRTVNPPNDTWMAFCHNKRGYKQHPHFQIGLFDDHLFIWLAYIYELPNKQEIAASFIDNIEDLKNTIPDEYVISLDHTKKESASLKQIQLNESLERFHKVKKAEFLVGRHISWDDPILKDGKALLSEVKKTFETLAPIYKLSMNNV
ncbi:YktB family protein [Virgibacillus flavescens]|uniref:YktB family protein n=1 Tax=Virgibacillus flavescens TaxID=1611422 RepID=UPI003D33F985